MERLIQQANSVTRLASVVIPAAPPLTMIIMQLLSLFLFLSLSAVASCSYMVSLCISSTLLRMYLHYIALVMGAKTLLQLQENFSLYAYNNIMLST